MSWDTDKAAIIHGYGSPSRVFEVSFRPVWRGKGRIELESFWARAELNPGSIGSIKWVSQHFACGPEELSTGSPVYLSLTLPWDTASLRKIEAHRAGNSSAPVVFTIEVGLIWRRVEELEKEQSPLAMGDLTVRAVGRRETSPVHIRVTKQRDEWLGLLKTLGWDEFETFELPVRSLKQHANLKQGLDLLRAAQKAFRQGQWEATAIEVRRACEAAAGAASQQGDLKQAFEALFLQVHPDAHDEPKRKMLNDLMGGLRHLRHVGAHAKSLRCQVRREDAELSLSVAIATFRYLGEALAVRP